MKMNEFMVDADLLALMLLQRDFGRDPIDATNVSFLY